MVAISIMISLVLGVQSYGTPRRRPTIAPIFSAGSFGRRDAIVGKPDKLPDDNHKTSMCQRREEQVFASMCPRGFVASASKEYFSSPSSAVLTTRRRLFTDGTDGFSRKLSNVLTQIIKHGETIV